MDESWVVKANRERDRLEGIKSRERLEETRRALIQESNERFERLYNASPYFDGMSP